MGRAGCVITIKSIEISINMTETAVNAAGCSLTMFTSSVTLSCDSSLLRFLNLQASGAGFAMLWLVHQIPCGPFSRCNPPLPMENSSRTHLVELDM